MNLNNIKANQAETAEELEKIAPNITPSSGTPETLEDEGGNIIHTN